MTLLKNKNEKFIKQSDLHLLLNKHNIAIISSKEGIVNYLDKQKFHYRLKRFGNKLVILINQT